LNELLFNESRKKQYKEDTEELYQLLSAGGKASQKAATIVQQMF